MRRLGLLERLWTTDIALTSLLVSPALYLFFIRLDGWFFQAAARCLFSLILITAQCAPEPHFQDVVFSWCFLASAGWVRYLFHTDSHFVATLWLFSMVLLTSYLHQVSGRPTTSIGSWSCCRLPLIGMIGPWPTI